MDDLSDIDAAFGSGAPAAGPTYTPPRAFPGEAPPLTVRAHDPSAAPDDLSDIDATFAQGAPWEGPPGPSALDTAKDVVASGASGLVRGVAAAPFAPAAIGKMGADAIVSGGDWLARKALGLGPASPETLDAQAKAEAHRPFGVPSLDDASNAIQSGLDPILHTPQTGAGRFSQTVGEFAPVALAGPGNAAKKLAIGAVAPAAGSEAAGNMTEGTSLEPYARFAGALAGGVGAAGAAGAAEAASNVAAPVVAKGLKAIGKPAMQERLAGQRLMQGAQDPSAFREALSQSDPDELVPGSKPTTFQLTGDQGLGQMERGDRTTNPAGYLQRSAEQNSARLGTLNEMQPTGNPEAVSAHLTDQLGQLDARAQSQIDVAKTAAQTAASGIGTGAGPELTGADLRSHIAAANDAAKANERQLWNAVDPDGTLANPTNAITQANQKIYGDLSPTAQAFISPDEKTFNGLITAYRPVEPFQTVADLRSNLAAAMRQERATSGSTPAYARMAQLMSSVQDTINNAIEHRAAVQAHAVSQGALDPDATAVARLKQWQANFYAGQQVDARTGTATGFGGDAGAGSVAFSSVHGAGGQGRGGLRNPPSDSGISPTALQPNFDADAAARLKAASQATKQNKQTFAKGPVGDVLRSAGTAGDYRLPNSAVPAKLFPAGPKGYEAVKSYHSAAGSTQDAVQSMQNAAMESLRTRAINGEGILQPSALAMWKSQHADALRAMDEASPDFSKRFDNAATATDDLMKSVTAKNDALKAFQSGAIGKLMGAESADEVVNRLGKIMSADDRVSQVQRLVQATQGNPDAAAGLRKAASDWMAKQFMTQTEAGTSGEKAISADKFKKLVGQSASVLSQLFTPKEMEGFRAVASDLDRANRSVVGSKVAGSPGTAQDTEQANKAKHAPASLMTAILFAGSAGLEQGGLHGAASGAALAGGGYMLNALRLAGIHDVQSLVSDALLNPDRARQYIKSVPDKRAAKTTAATLTRSFLAYPMIARNQ